MIRRTLITLLPALALLAAVPVSAQAETIAPAVAPLPRVSLETAQGRIVIEVDSARAPLTAANFLRYVDQKRLDGTSFYRALKLTPEGLGLVQGGIKSDPKRALPAITHEPTSQTGLSHVEGAVSMARGAPGTAQGDFFILTGAIPSLDAQSSDAPGDTAGFAVFGKVVEGMEVVRLILDAPTSATLGEGVMRGQMIEKPVIIRTARRLP